MPENGEEKKHAATAPKAKQDGQLFFLPTKIQTHVF